MLIGPTSFVVREKQDTILSQCIEDKLEFVYIEGGELVGKQVPLYFIDC